MHFKHLIILVIIAIIKTIVCEEAEVDAHSERIERQSKFKFKFHKISLKEFFQIYLVTICTQRPCGNYPCLEASNLPNGYICQCGFNDFRANCDST